MPTSDQPVQRLVTCRDKDTGAANGALERGATPHAAVDCRNVSRRLSRLCQSYWFEGNIMRSVKNFKGCFDQVHSLNGAILDPKLYRSWREMEWIEKQIESKVLAHYSRSFRPNLSHNPLPRTYQIPEDETLTYMQRQGVRERKWEREDAS